MKNVHTACLAAAVTALAMTGAHAQTPSGASSKLYAELGYAALSLKETVGTDSAKASPGALTGVFGYRFMPQVSVEGLVGLGVGQSGVKENGVPNGVDVKVGNALGVFLRPSVSVSDRIDLFARAGWLRTTLKITEGSLSESGSDNSFAYGLGANFHLSDTSYIQANWMQYYNKDGLKVNGIALAYGTRF